MGQRTILPVSSLLGSQNLRDNVPGPGGRSNLRDGRIRHRFLRGECRRRPCFSGDGTAIRRRKEGPLFSTLRRRIFFRKQPVTVEEKLRSLGLVFPLPSVPAGVAERGITPELAKIEAELSDLNILAALKVEAGRLDKVKGACRFWVARKRFRHRRPVPASSTTPPNSLSRSAEKAVLRRAWRSALRGVRGNLRDFASGARLKKLCGTRGRSIALAGRAAPYRRSRGDLRAKPGGVRSGKERSVPDEQIGASRRGRRICRI